MRRYRVFFVITVVFLLTVFLGLLIARHVTRRGWPQTDGVLKVTGLRAPVTIVRDGYGVPHIFAANEDDLFFAQGYVHAQDRLWQMELQRRQGRGTLAQLLGDDAIESDEQWGALNLPDVAGRELAGMDATTRAPLVAYAAGINAWLATQPLPFEFTLLGLRGHEVKEPDPWTAEDSLVVALALSAQVAVPRTDPSLAARILQRVGPDRAAFLLDGEPGALNKFSDPMPLRMLESSAVPLPRRWALSSQVTLVGGDRTESGKPIVSIDLPTSLDLPAPWYVMVWRADRDGAAGASLPGTPGLVVGIDDKAMWEKWVNPPQYAVLSLLKELVPGQDTPPWQRWVLAALFSTGRNHQFDGDLAPQTVDELQVKKQDTYSTRAARLVPLLVQVEPKGWRQERVTGMLRKWDFRVGDNNKEAPFFAVYQLELARAAFADELGNDLLDAYVAQSDLYQVALDRILDEAGNEWWDDVATPQREVRDDIIKRAYEPTLEWLGRNYGDLHMLWEWDIVHGSRLHHALGDAWPWDQLLSRGLNPDGWAGTIYASPGGLPCTGDNCMGGDIYRAKAVYGYRQISDANDPSTLWFSLLPGQSGHPFHPHYDDLLDEWLAGDYLPLRLAASPDAVDGRKSELELVPRKTD
jgi:acyl-homoserine lactone acylase PvdQ